MSKRQKRHKGYWIKKKEVYPSGTLAKSRASELRRHEYISHVIVEKKSDDYEVSFSIAKFYMEELEKAGVKL